MTNYEAANETDSEGGMWLVRLPNGGVRAVTLEQLDDAYQRDFITGDTEVLEEGTSEWRKLRELIGDDEAPPPPPVPVSHVTSAPASQVRYAQQVPPSYGRPPSPPAMPTNVRAANSGQGYPVPTMPMPASAMSAVRPPASLPPTSPGILPQTTSTAPVASNVYDFDLDLSGSPFKRKSRRGLFVVAALLVVGGVGAAVVSSQSSSVAAASPEPTKAQVSLPIPPAKALPAEPELVEKPKPAADTRLSNDTKKALAEADKKREKTKSAKRASKAKAAASGKRSRSGGSSVFTKGGDSHDPLNGSL